MQKGHFWPLEAGKREIKDFLGPWNNVFRVLWPPEAKKDPSAFNTKKFDFENNFFAFYVKRSYLASGGQKTAKKGFSGPLWVHAIRFFMFTGLQGHKMTPHQKTQKNPILKKSFLYFM